MSAPASDRVFAGSIPRLYETYLVPLIFEPYAAGIANRLRKIPVTGILEIAAGTGVVTRAMSAGLGETVSIVSTDLNQAMIDQAASIGTKRPVTWRQADAMDLPFENDFFDAVVCQFGVMFFPDKPKALAEARRVLRPKGVLIFNVWDRIEENEFADAVTQSLAAQFPSDPPRFLPRTPYAYHDRKMIEKDLARAGFDRPPGIDTVAARSKAASASIPATAFIQGTPLRGEVEAKGASMLDEATGLATEAIARQFGHSQLDARIQALVVTVEK